MMEGLLKTLTLTYFSMFYFFFGLTLIFFNYYGKTSNHSFDAHRYQLYTTLLVNNNIFNNNPTDFAVFSYVFYYFIGTPVLENRNRVPIGTVGNRCDRPNRPSLRYNIIR